jgi:hypothetical protein
VALPDLTSPEAALNFQTCLHEAAHALLTLLSTELTLKDPAIVNGPTTDHVALTCTTAVHQFVPSVQKHRDLVRVSLGGSVAEQELERLTRDSEDHVPAVPSHWSDDLELMVEHLTKGQLFSEAETLAAEAERQVKDHWEFVVELAKLAMKGLPVSRKQILDLAVKFEVLKVAGHP